MILWARLEQVLEDYRSYRLLLSSDRIGRHVNYRAWRGERDQSKIFCGYHDHYFGSEPRKSCCLH
jgi:hypothetical protein